MWMTINEESSGEKRDIEKLRANLEELFSSIAEKVLESVKSWDMNSRAESKEKDYQKDSPKGFWMTLNEV